MSMYTEQFALNTSTGLQTFTMPKITDGVNVIAAIAFATPPVDGTIAANSSFGIGYADGTSTAYTTISSQDGLSNTDRRSNTNAMLVVHASSGGPDFSFNFDSFGAKSLTVDITDAPAAATLVTIVLFTDEAFAAAAVYNQSLGTGTSEVSIATAGVDPDLIFASSIGANAAATNTSQAIFSLGVAADNGTQINNALVAYWDENGQATADSGGLCSSVAFASQTFNGVNSWNAAVTSMGTAQFGVTPDASAGSDFIFGLALQKSADASVNVVSAALPAATGNQAFTGLGFEPQSALMLSTGATAEDAVQTTACTFAYTAIDSAATVTAATSSENGANPPNANSLNSNDFSLLAADGTRSHQATLTSFDVDGLTLNFTTATTATRTYIIGVSAAANPQIDSIDTDGQVSDGQGTATLETSGFSSDINSVLVGDGTYASANIFIGGAAGSWTWTVPDLLNLVADTSPGQPNWLTGSLNLTASDGTDNASDSFIFNAQANTDIVTVLNANTDPGSVFEGLPSPPADGSVVYYSTAGNTAIAPDGAYESDLQTFNLTLWHIDTGVYEVGTVDNTPSAGGIGGGSNISLGIGLGLTMIRPKLNFKRSPFIDGNSWIDGEGWID